MNKQSNELPKISCLMVTCGRIAMIKRSVQCYCDQTYPNRELIILSNEKPAIIKTITDCLALFGNRSDIKFEALADRKYTLGELRNKSIEKAKGSIVCIWDDDDLYHPERLSLQYKNMEKADAAVSLLTDYLHFFWTDLKLAWAVWQSNFPDEVNGLPGSLMIYKKVILDYPEQGQFANAGEDSHLLYRLYQAGIKVAKLSGRADLYLYSFHGNNTWALEHHERLFHFFRRKRNALSDSQNNQLDSALNYYQLPSGYKLY
ncbi:MAG: hypothetical protein Sapg2KO_43680 [Saprospiraceae bacterium]